MPKAKLPTLRDIVANQAAHEKRDADRFQHLQDAIDKMAPQLETIHQYFTGEAAVNIYKVNLKKAIVWFLSAVVATLTIVTLLLQIIKWFN